MAGGVKSLRKIQLGRETTAGTAVVATAIWRGLGTIEDTRTVVYDEEDVGLFAGTTRNHTEALGATLPMSGAATFEQLPYVLEAGINAVNTGTIDTGGSGFVYTYTINSAATTPATYTIEGGDNIAAEEMEYAYVESFTLTAEPRTAMQLSANWVGRQVNTAAYTAVAGGITDVEDILSSKGRLYIDTTTIGTTTASQTLMGATLNWNTGLLACYTVDSNALTYSWVKPTRPSGTLELTYEHNATAVAEKAAWVAGTPRLFRLLWQGSNLTTAGTFTYKTLRIDAAGRYEKFSAIADRDGNDIVTATARIGYEETPNLALEIKVVNQLAALL